MGVRAPHKDPGWLLQIQYKNHQTKSQGREANQNQTAKRDEIEVPDAQEADWVWWSARGVYNPGKKVGADQEMPDSLEVQRLILTASLSTAGRIHFPAFDNLPGSACKGQKTWAE